MVDLTGMLSQINSTIGSMGEQNGRMLGGVIANSMMPEVDPNNPQSMRKYADWARRNGKPQEAMIMEQRAMEAERAMQKQAVGQAKNRMVGAYANAVKTGGDVQTAYDQLNEFANNAGLSVLDEVTKIDAAQRAAEDQQYQQEQQAVQQKRQNAQQMAMGAMAGKTEEEIQKAVANAPADVRDVYQSVATRELEFQNQVAASEERKADLKTPVDLKGVDAAIGSITNEENKSRLQAEKKTLEGSKGNYWDEGKGQWKSLTAKRAWEREVNNLHRTAFDMGTRETIAKQDAVEREEQDFQRALGRARSGKVTETEIENYIEAVAADDGKWNLFGYGEIDRDAAIAGVIAERERGVREAYGRVEAPKDGQDVDPNQPTDEELLGKY